MAPTQDEVHSLFRNLENPDTSKNFWDKVADNVNWWIVGHTPMSRTYNSKQDFLNATIELLNKKVLGGPLRMKPLNVVAGADGWAVVELEAIDATCRNGLPYDMRYCWVCKFGDSGMIEQVRAYLDTDLLSTAIAFNR